MTEPEDNVVGAVVTADVPVVEVTVSEDRAQVTRKGRVVVPRGQVTVRIDEAAPVLVDRTLAASVDAPGVEVVDVRARRERVVEEARRPAALRALDRELEAVEDRQRARAAELDRTDRELGTLLEAIAAALSEMAEDAGWGRTEEAAWSAELGRLEARQEELGKRRVELTLLSKEDAKVLADLRTRREAGEDPRGAARARVEVELLAGERGEVELRVDYVVPGACWRPQHVARLLDGESRLAFTTEACVWQSTGEPWPEVRLLLSTQRPSEGLAPPLLATDLLAVGPRQAAVVVEARDQQVFTTGLGRDDGARSPGVPGIDDGGDTLTFQAREPATVPSDGRPHRFELFGFETATAVEIVAMPELAEAALWRAVQTNEAARPVLAGPVDLLRDCGLVGRTSVLYVAPGESFPLGFGPEGSLRVHREVEVQDEESSLLSAWSSRATIVTVRVSNIGVETRPLTVVERVPVSEIDKVQIAVDRVETTGEARPDAQGHLRWDLRVPGLSTKTVRLRYVVKKRGEVHGL